MIVALPGLEGHEKAEVVRALVQNLRLPGETVPELLEQCRRQGVIQSYSVGETTYTFTIEGETYIGGWT